MVETQTALYARQAKGFDEHARQKYLDSVSGPYSILFQDLSLADTQLPTIFTQKGFNAATKLIEDNLQEGCYVPEPTT